MVVVDRLTKQSIFVPCNTTDDAPQLAKLFLKHVFSKHGLPTDIVSDRGVLFTSKFWRSLCSMLDIQQRLSTAYHPQTDGQTERTNQTLEQYLRIFVNYDQDDWEEWLPLAEFVYNNTPSDATGISPFFANKGFHPKLTLSLKNVPSHNAHLKVQDMKSLNQFLKDQISKANQSYEMATNKHRRTENKNEWKEGTKVWLNAKNILTKRPMKKLDYKKWGPFKILQKISSHAYKLDLPKTMRGIHNVFHIDLLTEHPKEYFPERKPAPQPPIEVEGVNEYVVEKILDSKRVRGRMKYLVRWETYGPEEDTWEPITNLENAKETVEKFHYNHPEKEQLKEGEWASASTQQTK